MVLQGSKCIQVGMTALYSTRQKGQGWMLDFTKVGGMAMGS